MQHILKLRVHINDDKNSEAWTYFSRHYTNHATQITPQTRQHVSRAEP
jgi:hypothetical protein